MLCCCIAVQTGSYPHIGAAGADPRSANARLRRPREFSLCLGFRLELGLVFALCEGISARVRVRIRVPDPNRNPNPNIFVLLHGTAQYCTQPTAGSKETACGTSCGHPAMNSCTCVCHYPRDYMKFECVRGCTKNVFGARPCGIWWDRDVVQACDSKTFYTSSNLSGLPTAEPFTPFTHHRIFVLRICEESSSRPMIS